MTPPRWEHPCARWCRRMAPRGPWPPRRGPRAFLWRAGFVAAPLFVLAVVGAGWLFGLALRETGIGGAAGSSWWPFAIGWRALVAVVAFTLVMRRVGRPLDDVVSAAERVADGDYSVRTREHGPRWLRVLARAFNGMTARLEEQRRQRRALMADVAHELRTPLAVMQGRLEGIVDGVYPLERGQVALLLDETRQLGRLVEDLRTLAHSEGGTLTLQKERTDLAILLEDAASAFRQEFERRDVRVDVVVADDLPLASVDPVRVREVVTNLLANALRYAPHGSAVEVHAQVEGTGVSIAVSDRGPGMTAAETARVFDRFYKDRKSAGSGLGLAIAKGLVEAHGGTIAVESTPGRGTTFRFTLPLG